MSERTPVQATKPSGDLVGPGVELMRNFRKGNGRFDAAYDKQHGLLTVQVRTRFSWELGLPKFGPVSPWSAADAQAWQAKFIEMVTNRWNDQYLLVPEKPNPEAPVRAVRVLTEVIPTAQNPHFLVKVGSQPLTDDGLSGVGSDGVALFAKKDLVPVTTASGLYATGYDPNPHTQVTAEHEFGHMLGNRHSNGKASTPISYGESTEQRDDIMGRGSTISPGDYEVFALALGKFYKDRVRFKPVPRTGAARGALIGGLALGLAGAVGGAIAGGVIGGAGGAVLGGLLGAAGGGLIGGLGGALIGSATDD